jgi:site-specific DNA recombinase
MARPRASLGVLPDDLYIEPNLGLVSVERRSRPIDVADLDDPALKERVASLKTIRGQAQADAERAVAMLESSGQQTIAPQMVQRFARTARERIRIDGGGYRRDHLRALAQRVEVADKAVRIIGSKSNLLQTLPAV